MITNVTAANFEAEVLNSKVPVLVDFWAAWCGPCVMQGDILEKFAQEIKPEEAKICKIDVDSEGALAAQFGVMSIPTLIAFKDGKAVNTRVGVSQGPALKKMLGL